MTTATTPAASRSSTASAAAANRSSAAAPATHGAAGRRSTATSGGFDQAMLALLQGASDTNGASSSDSGDSDVATSAAPDAQTAMNAAQWLALLQAGERPAVALDVDVADAASPRQATPGGSPDDADVVAPGEPPTRDDAAAPFAAGAGAAPFIAGHTTAPVPVELPVDASALAPTAGAPQRDSGRQQFAAGLARTQPALEDTAPPLRRMIPAEWPPAAEPRSDTKAEATAFASLFSAVPAAAERTGTPKPADPPLAAAPLAGAQWQPVTTPVPSATEMAPLAATPGTPEWNEGFAERVTLLLRADRSEAEITLHPADLGPVEVRIRVEDGLTSLQFDAPRAETRQAIEDAMPRLREMMEGGGLSLGQTQVGSEGRQNDEGARRQSASADRAQPAPAADAVPEAIRRVQVARPGRVDTFV